MTRQEIEQAIAKIAGALKASSSLMVVEVWAPPIHEFEKERRHEAREMVQKLCLEAVPELEKVAGELGLAIPSNAT